MNINICPKCGKPLQLGANVSSGSPAASLYCFNPNCSCDKNIKIDYEAKDFENIIKYLGVAYTQFCFNREMHKEVGSDFYGNFDKAWDIILISLELEYILGLAKVLKLKIFRSYEFTEHREIIDKIFDWRDKFMAHFDLSMMRDAENFRQKNPLDPSLIESLFNKLIELVGQFNRRYKLPQNLKEFFGQIKKNSLRECDKWLDSFTGAQ